MNDRTYGKKLDINQGDVKKFFENRAKRANSLHPLAPVIYQDSNPALAEARDCEEKRKLLPLMHLTGNEHVLDIGCGIGRWADVLKDKAKCYVGLDYTEQFISIAKERLAVSQNVTFGVADARQLDELPLLRGMHFDRVLFAGLFIYLNDIEAHSVLSGISKYLTPSAKILIREPLGIEERLTLNSVWSEELQFSYSAIYRSVVEFRELLNVTLGEAGFTLTATANVYDGDLNNRKETRQQYFVLERQT